MSRTFHQDLILNQWVLSLFNQQDLKVFKDYLGDKEGIVSDGQTEFFHELTNQLFETDLISHNDLRRYDLNIIKHWQQITEQRNKTEGHILNLKYFQYLSLLFAEIYLDFYFSHPEKLLSQLNAQLKAHLAEDAQAPEFQPYIKEDLNKIAFWNATGSGKTLLMHVNILQYLEYCKNRHDLTVFVITPNEGLSKQHLNEFIASNLSATIFDRNKGIQNSGLFNDIQIIEISKLAEKTGESTVAVESFSSMNKLILIDEGHRGSSGNEWLSRRQRMIGDGFAFEYSATFGQAVKDRKIVADMQFEIQKKLGKAQGISKKADVQKLPLSYADRQEARQKSVFETYAKCVLFDYSYKFFYADGYGKESLILNMKEDDYANEENLRKYFIACLLSFYQQQYLFAKHQPKLTAYNLEKPLWIFVGNTVNAEDSDIFQVISLLAFFLNPQHRSQVLTWLTEFVEDKTTLLDSKGNAIFKHRFHYLMDWQGDVEGLYADILKQVFNAESAQQLELVQIKKASGEVALRVGGHTPFGVINVGDSNALMKEAAKHDHLTLISDEFSPGLFAEINRKNSELNLLIGSRKFTEGWSSWRVSTMGLLNMGKSEGSQIIQLFGRGVRLKGEGFSLKRTVKPPRGLGLDKLETLNVFGIKADYMQKFREYLLEEGVNTEETLQVEFPVVKTLPQGVQLKTLRLKDGYKDNQKMGFKRQETAELYKAPEKYQGKIKPILVEMDLYPKLEAMSLSQNMIRQSLNDERLEVKLNPQAVDFFDWDAIYLTLQQYKMERTWSNLRVSKTGLQKFVAENHNWYRLYSPASSMEIRRFADVEKQQEILIELLKNYTEQFYQRLKSAYENQFFEMTYVTEENGSLLDKYQFELREDPAVYNRESAVEKLEALAKLVRERDLEKSMYFPRPFNELQMICFKAHLFSPLLHLEKSDLPVKLSPLLIKAESEQKFVHDLMKAEKSGKLAEWLGGKSLYLMRNADKKERGLGFALAGNFYPDFLLWVVDHQSGKQWLNFVDPKGIRNMSEQDPKFGLYQEVKTLQEKIGDPNLVLNSFILSVTDLADWTNMHKTEDELAERHILFMHNEAYLAEMFGRMNDE
ncbi:DEAD/DEAH box helicase family protein [Haemophilus paraphrohaemolyticus]